MDLGPQPEVEEGISPSADSGLIIYRRAVGRLSLDCPGSGRSASPAMQAASGSPAAAGPAAAPAGSSRMRRNSVEYMTPSSETFCLQESEGMRAGGRWMSQVSMAALCPSLYAGHMMQPHGCTHCRWIIGECRSNTTMPALCLSDRARYRSQRRQLDHTVPWQPSRLLGAHPQPALRQSRLLPRYGTQCMGCGRTGGGS